MVPVCNYYIGFIGPACVSHVPTVDSKAGRAHIRLMDNQLKDLPISRVYVASRSSNSDVTIELPQKFGFALRDWDL